MKRLLFALAVAVSLSIVIVSCKSTKVQKESVQQEQADLDDIIASLRKNVPGIDITKTGDKVKITLGEASYFNVGSAELNSNATTKLDQMASVLNKYSQTEIKLNGYTDNTGTDQINKKLSDDRAVSVKNYLVSKNVAAGRIKTAGYAAANPVADNTTADGRAQNRRVEFIIYYAK